MLQFVFDFRRSDFQPHARSLAQQGLTIDHLVDGAHGLLLNQKGHQLRRHFAIALRILLRHLARGRAHLVGGDVTAIHLGHDALAGRAAGEDVPTQTAGDQRNHHRRADDQEQPAQNILRGLPGLLQETNHFLITPECRGEFLIINQPGLLRPEVILIAQRYGPHAERLTFAHSRFPNQAAKLRRNSAIETY